MLCPCQALGAGGLGGHSSGQAGFLQQRQTLKGLAAGDVLLIAFPPGYFLKGDVLVHLQLTMDSFYSACETKIESNE